MKVVWRKMFHTNKELTSPFVLQVCNALFKSQKQNKATKHPQKKHFNCKVAIHIHAASSICNT
jgi:hypothetical protein